MLIGLQCYQAQNRRFKIFAKKIERDPGIVLGRLLNDGQDYLISGEELNRLANDSWFDKSVKFEER